MANKDDRFADNVPGRYYVDNSCIDCDLCREVAPDFFSKNEDGGYSYVFRQPTNEEEEAHCIAAMEGCPVDAVGYDGE